jgi:hypothetical protein
MMGLPFGDFMGMSPERQAHLVLVTYALGLSNGGMAPREALWRYTGAIPVMAGSGATTPTRRQVELIEVGIDVRTLGMKEVLGVRVTVQIHGSGALDSYTGTSKTSKVKRLADRRK